MSYALGAAAAAQPSGVGRIVASAYAAVDASDLPLSPPAEALFLIGRAGIEQVVGKDIEAVLFDAVPDKVLQVIADTVGDVTQAVPIVSTFIGVITGVFSALSAFEEKARQQRAEDCKKWLHDRRVRPSNVNGTTVPADIFARQVSLPGHHGWKDRSLLGEALIAVTEGVEIDGDTGRKDLDDSLDSVPELAHQRERLAVVTCRYRKRAANQPFWEIDCPTSGVGVPEKRRRFFRLVRQAIEASWRPPGGGGLASDGGVALWPVYLDMLYREFREGHLTDEYVRWLVGASFYKSSKTWDLNVKDNTGWECYVPALSDQVLRLRDAWRDTIEPRYTPHTTNLAKLKKDIAKIRQRLVATNMLRRSRYFDIAGPVLQHSDPLRSPGKGQSDPVRAIRASFANAKESRSWRAAPVFLGAAGLIGVGLLGWALHKRRRRRSPQ